MTAWTAVATEPATVRVNNGLDEAVVRSGARADAQEVRRRARSWPYRIGVLVSVGGSVAAFRVVRAMVWGSRGYSPHNWFETVLSNGSLLWALPSVSAALALVGLLLYPGPRRAARPSESADQLPIDVEVCFRIVSRGTNVAALRSTIANVRAEMAAKPLFPYRIETVTDLPVLLEASPDLTCLVVPTHYETAYGSRYKARALQFALEQSSLPEEAWIMHLDEESHITPSLVVGIRDAVEEEERTGAHRLGQGAILYHHNLRAHPVLTLADMLRTGDDLGRFYLQHRLGYTIFGLHGSFILVRNDVERAVGFDFGPEGSITEDAFWALSQMARGARCRWVDGFVEEQCPQSVSDFVKQRRRWFSGTVRAVAYAEVQAWIRVPLALFTALWAVSWLSITYTLVNAFTGMRVGPVVSILGDFTFAVYGVGYLLGLHVNLRQRPGIRRRRRLVLYVLQAALIPVFSCLEAAGVLAGMLRPERGFHVVQKSGTPAEGPVAAPPAGDGAVASATSGEVAVAVLQPPGGAFHNGGASPRPSSPAPAAVAQAALAFLVPMGAGMLGVTWYIRKRRSTA